jgi:hypothetical protein
MTSRYIINLLVYYDGWAEAYYAVKSRSKAAQKQDKIDLLSKMNPRWCDLYEQL